MDIAFARLAASAAKLQGNHVGLKEDFVDLKSGVLKVAMSCLPYFHMIKHNFLSQQNVVSNHHGHPVEHRSCHLPLPDFECRA